MNQKLRFHDVAAVNVAGDFLAEFAFESDAHSLHFLCSLLISLSIWKTSLSIAFCLVIELSRHSWDSLNRFGEEKEGKGKQCLSSDGMRLHFFSMSSF